MNHAMMLFLLAALGLNPTLALDVEESSTIETHLGEPLDPSAYGPQINELLTDVVARAQAAATEAATPGSKRGASQGRWVVPSHGAISFPHSGHINLVNEWGDTRLGVRFPRPVDVHGAYLAGQAATGAWTTGIRVAGYLGDHHVATTDWFENIKDVPQWFAMNLRGVDRIVFEATPVLDGAGWFGLDDLSFTPVAGANDDAPPVRVVLDFEDCTYRQVLTGSGYAGLTWESGTGDFAAGPMPPPQVEPGYLQSIIVPEDAENTAGLRDLGTLPNVETSYQGPVRGDAGQYSYPPDTCGAVGPNHFVSVVNGNFSIYDKFAGTRLVNISLSSFFDPFPTRGDPRVLFDQHSNRWIVTSSRFDTDRRIQLAVSHSADPTGGWFKTSFATDGGADANCWPDYPTLGVNADGIYITSYMVGCGMSIFALDKAPLIATPPSLGAITAFRGLPFEGAIQPVHAYGSTTGEYFVSRRSRSAIRVRKLTGSPAAPNLSTLGDIAVPAHNPPPDAPALGSSTPLDTVDARLMNAVYRDGVIWTAHTIALNGRAACRWYQLQPETLQRLQYGTISDTVRSYFFPSLSVNRFGNVVMGFTGASASQYAAAYYTGRTAFDPANEMAPPALLMAGSAQQNNLDQYGRNRWGDYSLTTLDPTYELTVWTIQEYAHSNNIWGTWIGALSYNDCNNNSFPDDQDIAAGTSLDCNANLMPDECELDHADCNANGVPDDCDIAGGAAGDCNANGRPDACDIADGLSTDCNNNAVPDLCDIRDAVSADCNANNLPDECELIDNDCNANAIPDDCDRADLAADIAGPDDAYVCPSEAAVFAVEVPGATAYLWLRNDGEALIDGGGVSGTTSPTLTLNPGGAFVDQDHYRCRVSAGCLTVTTAPATLHLLPTSLDVSLITPSPLEGCSGSGSGLVTFQVAVDDPTAATYQWSKDGVNLEDGGRIYGAHAAQLEIAQTVPSDSGDYTCQVSNACLQGDNAVSTTGVLTFVDPVFTRPPADVCAEYGTNARLQAIVASPVAMLYRWYENGQSLNDGGRITGAHTDTLTIANVQPTDDGRQFQLLAAVISPPCTAFSTTATLTARAAGACPPCPQPGDFDGDGDYDLLDLQGFTACIGQDIAAMPVCGCANLADDDQLIDAADWAALADLLTGPQ